MQTLRTEIHIAAPPQTVWSILDDLARYGEWNRVLPRVEGRTTVGETLDASIRFSNGASFEFGPRLLRVVGARELRWVSEVPGEEISRAEHYFILSPTPDGGTQVLHCESFSGPMAAEVWPMMETTGRQDYEELNEALRVRAEAAVAEPVPLHPSVDAAQTTADTSAATSVLRCLCASDPVELRLDAALVHNHLCGCSQCWKPAGALFAMTAVVPADVAQLVANATKLRVVDAGKAIRRQACSVCGVHMLGEVPDRDHHFHGLAFVHPELGGDPTPPPEFAGFVSSLIESGVSPTRMAAIRSSLARRGIPAFDAFSPEIMDLIAWHRVKMSM